MKLNIFHFKMKLCCHKFGGPCSKVCMDLYEEVYKDLKIRLSWNNELKLMFAENGRATKYINICKYWNEAFDNRKYLLNDIHQP